MRAQDQIYVKYLLALRCAVEIRRAPSGMEYVSPVPPPFLAMTLSDGRPYCQHHEDYAALGARVMTAFDTQNGSTTAVVDPSRR
jgi:hypothetical protein